jgi:transposase
MVKDASLLVDIAAKGGSEDEAIGRSRGGLSTKISASVDALGNPVRFILTAGQVHDILQAEALISGLSFDKLLADKGYDSDRFRACISTAGAEAVIPSTAPDRKLSPTTSTTKDDMARTIACLSMPCCGWLAPAHRGAICRKSLVTGTAYSSAFKKGVWERIFNALAENPDFEYRIIDCTIVRAHQHAAGLTKSSIFAASPHATRRLRSRSGP